MRFEQRDKYHMASAEGYTVAKTFSGERVRYTAWKKARPSPLLLKVCDTAQAAMTVCEAHYLLTHQEAA